MALDRFIQVQREEIYQQAWAEPMSRLAERYSISGVALAKICRKMNVPVPPRGYWERRRHGYKPARPPLPKLSPGTPSTVTISRPARQEKQSPGPEAAAQIDFEKHEKNRIRVPERLVHPHPLVRSTKEAFREAAPDDWGRLHPRRDERCLDMRIGRPSLSRALRIMNALVKALEARRLPVTVGDGTERGTYVGVHGETVQIAMEEPVTRVDHVPTREEQERQQKWGSTWMKKWDYVPTGILKLRIDEYAGKGVRKSWSDGRQRRIEEALNKFIAGVILVAEAKRNDRLAREQQRKEWEEEERRRAEIERQRREEEARGLELQRQAECWAKSQQIRTYIEAVEQGAIRQSSLPVPGSNLHGWLQWARRYANGLDPLRVLVAHVMESNSAQGHDPAAVSQ